MRQNSFGPRPRNGNETAVETPPGKGPRLKTGKRLEVENAVRQRYAEGAAAREAALCCPVDYDPKYLKILPREILEKDYGCGDPSRYLRPGETVLDLGSGAGKICYIASQIVGPKGRVIGIDFNPAMLKLARKYQKAMAKRIGWNNVAFHWGRIQDLGTPLEEVAGRLKKNPVRSLEQLFELESRLEQLRHTRPMIADDSVDAVVSNCVLNLVTPEDKNQLFREMHRVLRKGGRAAISDIVADEAVPEELQRDPELWSGCISGAFEEKAFLAAFEEAGFYGIRIDKRDEKPWRVVKGIEFRSVTVVAYKGKEGPCRERNQAVIYKGPWKQVTDDDGHVLKRGSRSAVCDKTFQIYAKDPYRKDFEFVQPRKAIPLSRAKPFDCGRTPERHPRETKGMTYQVTTEASVCTDGGCC